MERTAGKDIGLDTEGMISPKFILQVIISNIGARVDFCKVFLSSVDHLSRQPTNKKAPALAGAEGFQLLG
jgi:hypothetical protein